jgi:SAM-dependent methyltransferase
MPSGAGSVKTARHPPPSDEPGAAGSSTAAGQSSTQYWRDRGHSPDDRTSRRLVHLVDMNELNETAPLERFGLANQARQSVQNLATGAQVLTLLTTLRDRGWFRFLAEPRDLDMLAEFSGLPPTRLADILAVLREYGVVEQPDGSVRLSPEYAALTGDDALISLDAVLDHHAMLSKLMRTGAEDPGPLPLSEDDALVIARAVGGRANDGTRAVYGEVLLPQLPELTEVLRNDRWLDVGCGVASATLTMATLYPEMNAVAIELVPTVAAETVRRAKAHGVADRVDVRAMDVRDLDEKDEFGGAFWAQPFFPESTRADTLAVILRALKPGGLLYIQEMEPEPDEAERPAYSVRRLVAQGWDVPFGRTAEQLADEVQAAGFELVRLTSTDLGRFVIARRPA